MLPNIKRLFLSEPYQRIFSPHTNNTPAFTTKQNLKPDTWIESHQSKTITMMFLKLLVLFAAVVAAIPDALSGTTALEIRDDEEWKYCGVFATCDRDGAKRLSDYIGSCTPTSKGGYGTEFEVEGIEYTDPLQNSSCVAIGCDLKTYAQVWVSKVNDCLHSSPQSTCPHILISQTSTNTVLFVQVCNVRTITLPTSQTSSVR